GVQTCALPISCMFVGNSKVARRVLPVVEAWVGDVAAGCPTLALWTRSASIPVCPTVTELVVNATAARRAHSRSLERRRGRLANLRAPANVYAPCDRSRAGMGIQGVFLTTMSARSSGILVPARGPSTAPARVPDTVTAWS